MKRSGSNKPRDPSIDGDRSLPRATICPSAAPANDTSDDHHVLVALLGDLAVLFADLHLQGRLEEIPDYEPKSR